MAFHVNQLPSYHSNPPRPPLLKTHSPIAMEMSLREKKAHHRRHHSHVGQCAHHPLSQNGAASWEHSRLHHGNRPIAQAGVAFYNHPKPLCPEFILSHKFTLTYRASQYLQWIQQLHSAVRGCSIKDKATTTQGRMSGPMKSCIGSNCNIQIKFHKNIFKNIL